LHIVIVCHREEGLPSVAISQNRTREIASSGIKIQFLLRNDTIHFSKNLVYKLLVYETARPGYLYVYQMAVVYPFIPVVTTP
jgi:hypothetical protein